MNPRPPADLVTLIAEACNAYLRFRPHQWCDDHDIELMYGSIVGGWLATFRPSPIATYALDTGRAA